MIQPKRAQNPLHNKRLIATTLILLFGIVAFFLGLHSHHNLAKTTVPSKGPKATTQLTEKSAAAAPDKSSSSTQNTQSSIESDKLSAKDSAQAVSLIAPSGNFVSNHRPGQNNSPTTESSVCNTTPGASCYIEFTMNEQTKHLDTKTTGSDGTAIWNWDIQDAGFSQGTWHITAVASLNGQTKTSVDSAVFEVQP